MLRNLDLLTGKAKAADIDALLPLCFLQVFFKKRYTQPIGALANSTEKICLGIDDLNLLQAINLCSL